MNGRRLRIGLLLAVLAFIGYLYVRERSFAPFPRARYIPPQGIAENDTHGKVPGDPARAIADAKRLYPLIQNYRKQHSGQYPPNASYLVKDLILHFQNYGIAKGNVTGFQRFLKVRQFIRSFSNPDARYSDDPSDRQHPNTIFPFFISNKRPDGSPVGGPKPPGTHDVLAYTNLYFHENVRHFRGDLTTSHPVGFFIVLWDDGSVQKIPYNQLLYVPQGYGNFGNAFPGQTGVPSNAMTYKEFQEKVVSQPQKYAPTDQKPAK